MVHRHGAHQRFLNRRSAITGAVATGIALAACGGRSTGARPASGTSAQTKPVRGGQVNLPQGNDPYNYDPTVEPQSNAFITALATDALLDAKTGADVKFAQEILQPGLADRWETPDPQTYIFHLHPGARFADVPPVNGRAVTSADVKFSYEYLSRSGEVKSAKLPASIDATYFTGMDRVDAPDPLTATVHFQAPFSPFLNYMAMRIYNPILPREIYDQDGTFAKRVAGSGPWQLDLGTSQSAQHWVVKRNPTYFKPDRPYIDAVQYLILTDTTTQLSAFTAKQIDVLQGTIVPVASVSQLKHDNPKATVIPYLMNAGGHLFENTRKPPLDDLRVRRAIALSIDRDEFLKVFSDGQGEWATAGGVQDLFTHDELRQMLPFDPGQAKQLLSAAGYPNGIDFELIYPTAAGREHWLAVDQLIQAQLKRAGINLTLKGLEVTDFNFRTRAGDYQLNWQTKAVQGDPDAYVYFTFYSKALGNYGAINDPDLDRLLEAQRQELDPEKRKETLRQAARRIADQAWSVGFYYGQAFTFVQPYVKNLAENVLFGYPPLYESWLAK